MSKKVLIALSILGIIGTGVAVGIGTYKAHDKIKKAVDEKMPLKDAVKDIAKDYIPAMAAVGATVGTFAANTIMGEAETRKLKGDLDNAVRKYQQAKYWYREEHKALDLTGDDKTIDDVKKITNNVTKMQACALACTDRELFRDVVSNQVFESTRADILLALSNRNKEMLTRNFAMYEDFYDDLDIPLDPNYKKHGWSWATVSGMAVDPWIEIEFRKPRKVLGVGYVTDFNYMACAGGSRLMQFEPVDDPESENNNYGL